VFSSLINDASEELANLFKFLPTMWNYLENEDLDESG